MKNEPKSSFKLLTQLIYLMRVPDPHYTYRNAVPNLNEVKCVSITRMKETHNIL